MARTSARCCAASAGCRWIRPSRPRASSARASRAAHEKGVLHRDLKPANVMIDGRGQVIIMDFGLAGLAEQLQGDVRSGTPAYMSPEQLAGTEVTVKSDIYALGLLLYEIFTGKRAFEAASLMELMQMQERAAPASITTMVRDLDPAVERVIMRCLQPDPRAASGLGARGRGGASGRRSAGGGAGGGRDAFAGTWWRRPARRKGSQPKLALCLAGRGAGIDRGRNDHRSARVPSPRN